MKKRALTIYLYIIFCLITPATAQEVINIANGEWPPYQSKHLRYHGFASRIVTEAFALEGIKVQYSFVPWKRAIIMSKTGYFDATFLWKFSSDKRHFFEASDPIIKAKDVFFHLKSFKFDWKSIEDLKRIKIGATLGYNYGNIFQGAEKEGIIEVERAPNDEMNLKKLLAKRINLFICDEAVGLTLLRRKFNRHTPEIVAIHPRPLNESFYYLLFSKAVPGNHSRIEKFNSGLRKLKNNRKFELYIKEGLN